MVSKNLKVIIFVAFLIVALFVYATVKNSNPNGSYDTFAGCISENGIKMYGAYWCNHCQNQKKEFGRSFKFVDYIECTQKQEECDKASIKGYPTWIFADGSRHEGEISFEKLAEKTGCELKKDVVR